MTTRAPRTTEITSPDNAVFKQLRDVLTSKGIKKHETFLVFGERAVRDTLNARADLVRNVITSQGMMDDLASPVRSFVREVSEKQPSFTHLTLSKPLFDELDLFGTKSPILALRTPELPVADLTAAPQGLEILCALSDPSNLGALLRSAAAFGASQVILLKESASPFHPKAVRAASAATLTVKLSRGPSILELSDARQLVALDMRGQSLSRFEWPRDVRLLLGEEGGGVPSLPATYVSIPMANGIESLNATVAASVAMYAYRSQN